VTHVLVVEDDPALRRALTVNLAARGYTYDETGNGEDALRLAGRRTPDVVFVDLGLPSISGLDVIRGLRAFTDVPIIVLSARGAERDKAGALDAGANDYVTKPFGVEELMARLRAAERVRAAQLPAERTIRTRSFVVDLDARRVGRPDGAEIHLTPIEWGLLAHLVQSEGRLVSQSELLTAVWGAGFERETHYLRVHLTHLRKKLERDPGDPVHIVTEPGVGYRFVV
jgi:two-component system, OmpR family, KDP operon response regulator KdpE